jgi:hypothetical protein
MAAGDSVVRSTRRNSPRAAARLWQRARTSWNTRFTASKYWGALRPPKMSRAGSGASTVSPLSRRSLATSLESALLAACDTIRATTTPSKLPLPWPSAKAAF